MQTEFLRALFVETHLHSGWNADSMFYVLEFGVEAWKIENNL